MKRSSFIKIAGISSVLIPIVPISAINKLQEDPQLDKALVQEFVGKSHSDIDRVKELLEEHPTLLNAAHDWKFGDFETGLGAATHVGHKELVRHFLDKGAQANLFTLSLFGELEILKGILKFSPKSLYAVGPHGLSLLHHAEKGGDEAKETKEYFKSLGLNKAKFQLY